ncbi:MAG: acetate--CoA ligase family protein [Nocardioidaceae bacterium]
MGSRLRRLLAPRHIAVVGGAAAAEAVRQCRRNGFTGPIWPVHPTRSRLEGLACYPDVAALPEAPDAALVAVAREPTIDVVTQLAVRGAGGAVCHASGFAETGADGERLQRALVDAAGDMPVIGPNCLGFVNYLDGAALWPDQHGGERVAGGVAVITQSGNVGQNLSMQRRSLPLGLLATIGNGAVTGVPDLVDVLLRDPRITAIGLHLEGVPDVAALSRVAREALRRRVPLVVLKSGRSALGARANASHTSSLAGSDVLADALFRRYGIGRVDDLDTFVETLKLLHVHGALSGARLASASCSGGEAALVADVVAERAVTLPPFAEPTRQGLRDTLGDRVEIANPLDYQTYIWGDPDEQRACFEAFLGARMDAHLLLLDVPREDRCDPRYWRETLDAFVAAHRRTRAPAIVASTLAEGLPEPVRRRLLDEGIAPLQGLTAAIDAIGVAARIGDAHRRADDVMPLEPAPSVEPSVGVLVGEHAGKRMLAGSGIPVPRGALARAADATDVASTIGYPVAVKAAGLAHKSDVGGVHLRLAGQRQVRDAVRRMEAIADEFLVEQMVDDAVAELVVGVRRDGQFGLAMTIGSGGVLVELMRDSVTVLLPTSRAEVAASLRSLRGRPLLDGYRGGKPGDVDAAVETVLAIAKYAFAQRHQLVQLEVNPLLVRPEGRGVVAADVLIERTETDDDRRRP